MRALFALLALANVAFFLWAVGFKPSSMPAAKPAHSAIEAQKIRLLTEPGVIVEPRTNRNANLGALAPVAPQEGQQTLCYTVGPFEDAAALNAAGVRLQELGLSYTERVQDNREPAGFRVFLDPFPDVKAAERRRQELVRLGFKDHAVITEPGRPIGISLGIFSVAENAQGFLARLAEKKVKAKMETLTRARRTQWLDTYPLTAAVAERVKQSFSEVRGAGVSEKLCPPPQAAP